MWVQEVGLETVASQELGYAWWVQKMGCECWHKKWDGTVWAEDVGCDSVV